MFFTIDSVQVDDIVWSVEKREHTVLTLNTLCGKLSRIAACSNKNNKKDAS
jgi:hypothetical protein